MPEPVEIHATSGVIGLWDEEAFSPPDVSGRDFIPLLRDPARRGDWFFIDAEDEVTYRIEVLVESEVPASLSDVFDPRFGSFHLRAPSGRLRLASIPASPESESFPVVPGEYVVTPYAQRDFDARDYDRDMEKLAGPGEWRYRKNMDKFGAIGCLGLALAALVLIVPALRSSGFVAAPLLALPWIAYVIVTRLPRYRAVQQLVSRYESSLPHFILALRRSAASSDIPGGWCGGL